MIIFGDKAFTNRLIIKVIDSFHKIKNLITNSEMLSVYIQAILK